MTSYVKDKSQELLEKLANSIYDRKKLQLINQEIFFTLTEVKLVESWLQETIQEVLKESSKY